MKKAASSPSRCDVICIPSSFLTKSRKRTLTYSTSCCKFWRTGGSPMERAAPWISATRSEEHTSELQSRGHLVCRLLLEKKKEKYSHSQHHKQPQSTYT